MRKLRAIWDLLFAKEWAVVRNTKDGYLMWNGTDNSLEFWHDFVNCLHIHVEDVIEQDNAIKQANKIING